jgi:hypothetical protein
MSKSNLVKTKDSQWLQIEICSEYLTNTCPRNDDCKNAHPPEHVEVENGKVIACYDSFKGRCAREVCKYYHPTNQLMEQLMMKGRNNLARNSSCHQQIETSVYPEFSGLQMRPSPENSLKRSADASDFSLESLYSIMCKRQAIERVQFPMSYQSVFQFPTPYERELFPSNRPFGVCH